MAAAVTRPGPRVLAPLHKQAGPPGVTMRFRSPQVPVLRGGWAPPARTGHSRQRSGTGCLRLG